MSKPVFLHYDKAALDAEYDNRRKVPNALDYLARFESRSRARRESGNAHLDLAYGPHPANTLDLFLPEAATGPVPVQVFVHGGYWMWLSKDEFSFVAEGFAAHGVATAVINYGLVPMVAMATLVQHCRSAVEWLHANAADLELDAEHIHVTGHSAGGQVAAVLGSSDISPPDCIRTICGLSGLYDLEPIRRCYLNDDLRLKPEEVKRFSPILANRRDGLPVLLGVGELEGPEYLRQTTALADAWADSVTEQQMTTTVELLDLVESDTPVHVMVLDGADHFSIVEQLGDPGSAAIEAILRRMG